MADKRHRGMRDTFRAWTGRLLAILVGLALCEAVLLLASAVSPAVKYQLSPPWNRNTVGDERLGKRMSPHHPDHDQRGYRNGRSSGDFEVLAIGDSMTYGYGAPSDGSWPHQLGELTGLSIYNAGVGGYGPPEYAVVLDELLILRPRSVLLGLYLGNDISGAYNSVYTDRRFPELESDNSSDLATLSALEKDVSLRDRALDLGMRLNVGSRGPTGWRGLLSRWSSLFRLVRSVRFTLGQRPSSPLRNTTDDSFEAASNRPQRLAFTSVPRFRTVFVNPEQEALALDLTDARIKEGWRITQRVLLSIQRKLRDRGIGFAVVLLHNKPLVYSELVRRNDPTFSDAFLSTADLELNLGQEVARFLEENDIQHVETLAAVRALFDEGRHPYHESDDQHPNSAGYEAIARAIQPLLESGESSTASGTSRYRRAGSRGLPSSRVGKRSAATVFAVSFWRYLEVSQQLIELEGLGNLFRSPTLRTR